MILVSFTSSRDHGYQTLLIVFVRKSFDQLVYNCWLTNFTGKSTLVNHLFYTNFKEMDAIKGRLDSIYSALCLF